MKRPLAGAILGYAGGIWLGQWFQPSPAWLWGAALGVGALAFAFSRRHSAWLWLLLILSGWANLVTHTAVISPDDLRSLLGPDPALVTVRGVVCEPPQVRMVERAGKTSLQTTTTLEVAGLERDGRWRRASGRVAAMTPGVLDAHFFKGREIEVAGALEPPDPPLAPGLLDYREYLRTRGVYFELKTGSTNDWRTVSAAGDTPPLTQRFLNWAQGTLALGLPVVDEPLRLIWAMALGWRTAFTGDVSDPFLRAGTMHLFAIDGLRIALVAGMLLVLLRLFRLPRAVCGVLAVPVIWFYTAATGWEPSAIRASVMMTLILFGWVLKRPGDLLNSLAAAALIILVWDPRQLFEAGFQLSFLVVLIIGLMLPPLNERVDEWVQLNPLVPLEHTPEWKQWGVKWLRHFLRYLALSLTAWLGSIPLAAAYFHLFSPVSVLANVVAVPLGAGALMSMMGSLVCGGWLPGVAVWFNHSAWFFMVAMTRVSEWSCALPGAYWYVTAPSWPVIGLYYAGLVAWLTGWLRPPKSKLARGLVLAGLAGLLGFGWWTWASARTEVRLTVLPLSGGATVFVEGGHNRWLINCGSEDAVELTLKPFLRAQGVNRLPPLIITTGEEDCCGGAATLLRLFAPDELFTSPSRFRSAAYRELTDRFDQAPLHHHSLSPGATAGCWEALYPGPDDHFARADDRALVLLGRFYQSRILLLSGLGRDGQSALLNQAPDLRADVVVAGLPAQGEPLCDALLAAVRPRVIVIADAAYPVTRRAGDALKARLARTGMRVIYTRTAGAVTIVAKPGGLEI